MVERKSGIGWEIIISEGGSISSKPALLKITDNKGVERWALVTVEKGFTGSMVEAFCQFFTHRNSPSIAFIVNNLGKFDLTLPKLFNQNQQKTCEILQKACDRFLQPGDGSTIEQLEELYRQVALSDVYQKLKLILRTTIEAAKGQAAIKV